ncbi:hypothetical protein BG418_01290 [Streptomyces sp. CBMA152]|nr:hypothetical protein [Streptomyces sp. CBMA152]
MVRSVVTTFTDRVMRVTAHRDSDARDGVTTIYDTRRHARRAGYGGFTSSELAPHTERSGIPRPPRLMLLVCANPAAKGGECLLTDGQAIHADLAARHPEALDLLSTRHTAFFGGGDGHASQVFTPQGQGRVSIRLRLDALARWNPLIEPHLPALRAAELASYGMVGVGSVFEAFAAGALDADDEVAILHTPDGRPVTEALVNLRAAFHRAAAAGQISEADARALEDLARALPYSRRSWAALGRRAADGGSGEAFGRVDAWRRVHCYDVKREDAEQALALVASGTLQTPDTGVWGGEAWRTSFVRFWTAMFRPVAGWEAPFLPVLQHQQLYDPAFPGRWRKRVLAAVAAPAHEEADALRVAADDGLACARLSRQQRAFWLTPKELHGLDSREALLRIIVRSARFDGAWSVWPTTATEAADLLEAPAASAAAVVSAFAINQAVEAADPRRSIAHLDGARIGIHLTDAWGLPADTDRAERDAAARDRAFRDFAGAVEVARAFYLGARSAGVPSAGLASAGASARPRT